MVRDTGRPDPTALDRETLVIAGVALLAVAMPFLAMTGMNVALGRVAAEFGSSFTMIQWVVTAYTLALATTIPLAGWGADRFGLRRIHVAGLVVFIVGSALCAFAWGAGSLIAFRVVQGLGAGIVIPTVTTVVTIAAGPHRRGRVIGILGVPLLAIPILGSILGGWFVDALSWRWIFLIDVPIGVLAIVLAMVVFGPDEPEPAHRPDWVGICLLPPGLALLLFGVAESAGSGLGAARSWLPALAGAVLVAAFLAHSWRARAPLVDVRTFVHTEAGVAAGTLLLLTIAIFGGLLLLPLYYQSVRGASPLEAGLLAAPPGLGAMAALPLAGWLTDRHGARWLPLVGAVLLAIGLVPFAFVTPETSLVLLCGFSFVLGVGDGLAIIPTMTAAMAAVRPSAIPRTSSAMNVIDQAAASVGTAAVSVILVSAVPARLGAGGLASLEGAPPAGGAAIAGPLAAAFASSFGWLLAVLGLALVPALALARGRRGAVRAEGPG
jgi:EmrB/QacA subfamily drug resistance transporter